MNSLKRTLKETFKPRKRRAINGIIVTVMLIVVAIAGIGLVSGTFFDIADTASIVDSLELTNHAVYSDQGYVTVQVKNNGNTAINGVYASLLVSTAPALASAGSTTNCAPGIAELVVVPAVITTATTLTTHNLDPGESVTLSGGLENVGTVTVSSAGAATITAPGATAILTCTGSNLQDRGEYIIQVNGNSDGDTVSKTQTVRAK